jgi:hypothetical protein
MRQNAPPNNFHAVTYQVQEGQRLSEVAALHGVPVSAIVAMNRHKPLAMLGSGEAVFASLDAGEDLAVPGILGAPDDGDGCGNDARIGTDGLCHCFDGYTWTDPNSKSGNNDCSLIPAPAGTCDCATWLAGQTDAGDCYSACMAKYFPDVMCPNGTEFFPTVPGSCNPGDVSPTVNGWNVGDQCGTSAHITDSGTAQFVCVCDSGTSWVDPNGSSFDCVGYASSGPSSSATISHSKAVPARAATAAPPVAVAAPGMSTGAKVAIGVGVAAAVVGGVLLLRRA